MKHQVDVLVVGGGPSGLTVAAEVGHAGASVMIVEKRSVSPVPRAGTLLPRPLELFDARGIAGRFISRISAYNPVPFQTSHIWGGMHPVEWTERESRFGFTLYLSQHETELVLQEWAQELGVDTQYQTELIDFDRDDAGVTATVRDAEGSEHQIRAKYLVGADGGKSVTRSLTDIDWLGREATFTGLVVTADMHFPWEGGTKIGHNTHGWGASFRFGPGQTRFTLVYKKSMQKPQDEPITIAEVEQAIEEIFGERITVPGIISATRYGDTHKVASRLSDDRVLLVGEAARLHYPASGVGMNFCIQDAFNLGWKLGAVATGNAGESLLDTYESERLPIIQDLMKSVDAQVGAQFNLTTEGLTFLDYFAEHFITQPGVAKQLCVDLNGLSTPYPREDGEGEVVGRDMPDFDILLRDGTSTRVYELLRSGNCVVLDLSGAETIASDEVQGLQASIIAGHPTRRPEGFADVTAVIVRPDAYVGWVSTSQPTPGDIRAAVKRILHLE